VRRLSEDTRSLAVLYTAFTDYFNELARENVTGPGEKPAAQKAKENARRTG
jgi:hypothetical protein